MGFGKIVMGVAAAVALLGGAVSASASTLYSNDFESGSTANITGVQTITTAPNGQKFLGILALGSSSTLTVNAAGYTAVNLAFKLYGTNSLDGDGTSFCCGPDSFRLKINGVTVLDNTFSNVPGWTQSYGGPGSPGQTGAVDIGALGYSYYGPDSTYLMSFNLAAGLNVIEFIGASSQDAGDEGFGIDNIVVSGRFVGGVPEPATWAMMILGFGLAGAAVRRSRTLLA